jgi:hypothetical protein
VGGKGLADTDRMRVVLVLVSLLASGLGAGCGGGNGSDPAVIDRDIAHIAPLGNFAVPGHVFPTTHLYFYMRRENMQPITVDVFAPADIEITETDGRALPRAGDGR